MIKIVFMGSQLFSCEFLEELILNKFDIVEVFTRAPALAGRGKILQKTPVQTMAENYNLKINTPKTLKNFLFTEEIDLIVVVGYGLILPKYIIEYPKYGCINVHPSLLPRWRGAAPIERQLMAGDHETAVAIMKMDEGLDTGDILSEEKLPISENDNFAILSHKMALNGKRQLIDVINNLEIKLKNTVKQSEIGITYAYKLTAIDKKFDFNLESSNAIDIFNRIRALSPNIGLTIKIKNLDYEFKVFEAHYELCEVNREFIGHGFVRQKKFYIICDDGYLMPLKIQKISGNGKILDVKDFVNGVSQLVNLAIIKL